MTKIAMILGATSSIARAAAHTLAAKGYGLYLAGRNLAEVERIGADIRVRYHVFVKAGTFDAEAFDTHEAFFNKAVLECGVIDGVLVCFGELGHPELALESFAEAKKIIDSNYSGAVLILTYASNYFMKLRQGWIIGISSVAGDRGRQSNYLYGSAKGAFSLYLQGLRNRLYPFNVRVITIKPGFVDTAMTYGKQGMFLVASPEAVGKKIVESLEGSRDVVYVPGFWRWILWIIRSIPECIFKRLKL